MGGIAACKVIEKCKGCKRVTSQGYCEVYPVPAYHWGGGRICQLASHAIPKPTTPAEEKKRIGQQKARKKVRMSEKTRRTYTRIGSD